MSKVKKQGPLGLKQRWSVRRKQEVVLRLLAGEPLDVVSREVSVEVYRLEEWRDKGAGGHGRGLAGSHRRSSRDGVGLGQAAHRRVVDGERVVA